MRRLRFSFDVMKRVARRVWRESGEDNVLGAAAELGYYFLLALFPMLIFLTSLIGFLPDVQESIFREIRRLAPPDAMRVVRETLLDALQHDVNPGVRVEAVNLLVHSLDESAGQAPEPPDAAPPQASQVAGSADDVPVDPSVGRVIHILEELQKRDPNRYVRMRSAAALRQIGSREVQ